MPILSILFLSALLSFPASAQIVTDRPDFVEAAATVGEGEVQIETSIAHSRDGSRRMWSTPTLLRIGLGRSLEVRVESELGTHEIVEGETKAGIADVALGLKWAASLGSGTLPAFALLAHADLPTGSAAVGGTGIRPSLRVVAEWALPADAGLGVMPGVRRSDGPDGLEATGLLGVVVAKEWGERLRTFFELGLERLGGSALNEGSWNTGATYLIGPATQLDAALSLPATSSAPALALTLGFSRLFSR